jgi:hypothetical protein
MSSSSHNLFADNFWGAYFAVGAAVNLIIADIAQHDAFLHGMASILTGIAAVVSIYLALTRRKG